MALRQIVLADKIQKGKEELVNLKRTRGELETREAELSEMIKGVTANTSETRKKEIEGQIDEHVRKRDSIEEKIRSIETEIADAETEIERMNNKSPKSNFMKCEFERKLNGGNDMYRDMESIVLRSNESLFEKHRTMFAPEELNMNLGKYIRGMVTGKWNGAENERAAMLTSGASSVIPAPLFDRVIDKSRNVSIFSSANVPTVIMDTDNLTVAKIKKDLAAGFKEEGEEATESTPLELEGIKLKSKTIYGYAYVSLEAINSAKNLDSILTDSFGKAVAEGIDKGMIYGVYSGSAYQEFAPSGIFNNDNINIIPALNSNYDDIIRAIGKIKANNGTATIMAINADTEERLSLLKDKNEQYLTPPKAVSDITRIVSNQLEYKENVGSDLLVFDPNALLIGVQQGINVKVFDGNEECIKKGLVCFRVMAMIDCVVLQPGHISRVTGFGKKTE